ARAFDDDVARTPEQRDRGHLVGEQRWIAAKLSAAEIDSLRLRAKRFGDQLEEPARTTVVRAMQQEKAVLRTACLQCFFDLCPIGLHDPVPVPALAAWLVREM